jgi:hypothetical protein
VHPEFKDYGAKVCELALELVDLAKPIDPDLDALENSGDAPSGG